MLVFTSPVETKFMQRNPFFTSISVVYLVKPQKLSQVFQTRVFSGNFWHCNYDYLNIHLVKAEPKIENSSSSKPFI